MGVGEEYGAGLAAQEGGVSVRVIERPSLGGS